MPRGAADRRLFRGELAILRRDNGAAGRASVEAIARPLKHMWSPPVNLCRQAPRRVALKTPGPANRSIGRRGAHECLFLVRD